MTSKEPAAPSLTTSTPFRRSMFTHTFDDHVLVVTGDDTFETAFVPRRDDELAAVHPHRLVDLHRQLKLRKLSHTSHARAVWLS